MKPAESHTMLSAMMEKRAKKIGSSVDEAVASFLAEPRPYTALQRRAEPQEVAAVIAVLCAEQASFVNGANSRVDSAAVASI